MFAIWFVCLCVMWITVKVGDGLTHTNLQTNSLADNKEKVNIWLISDNYQHRFVQNNNYERSYFADKCLAVNQQMAPQRDTVKPKY